MNLILGINALMVPTCLLAWFGWYLAIKRDKQWIGWAFSWLAVNWFFFVVLNLNNWFPLS